MEAHFFFTEICSLERYDQSLFAVVLILITFFSETYFLSNVLELILIFRVLSCLVQTCKAQIFRELTCEKLICVTLYVLAPYPIY